MYAQHQLQPIVVGHGRVGKGLSSAISLAWGSKPHIVRRGATVPADKQGPIYIATTTDTLRTVINHMVPRPRHCDLVLFQNGMLHELFDDLQLAPPGCGCGDGPQLLHAQTAATRLPQQPVTLSGQAGSLDTLPRSVQEDPHLEGPHSISQVLLYASANAGGEFTDGGGTVVSGRWAQHVTRTLQAGGVACREVHGAELQAGCVEKSLWASIFWLLSAGLGGITVGEVVTHHKQAVKDLAHELLPLAVSMLSHEMQASQFPGAQQVYAEAAALISGPEAEARVVDNLLAYSERIHTAVPSRAMAIAEFRWRNGFFIKQLVKERIGADRSHLSRATDIVEHLLLSKTKLAQQTSHEWWLAQAGLSPAMVRSQLASDNV